MLLPGKRANHPDSSGVKTAVTQVLHKGGYTLCACPLHIANTGATTRIGDMVEVVDIQCRLIVAGHNDVGFSCRAKVCEVQDLRETADRAEDDERVKPLLGHHAMDCFAPTRELTVGESQAHVVGIVAHQSCDSSYDGRASRH